MIYVYFIVVLIIFVSLLSYGTYREMKRDYNKILLRQIERDKLKEVCVLCRKYNNSDCKNCSRFL